MHTTDKRLLEYRVLYNAGAEHSAINDYHYYMAYSASEALEYHDSCIKKHKTDAQLISIESYNPYSEKWEDCTDHIIEE